MCVCVGGGGASDITALKSGVVVHGMTVGTGTRGVDRAGGTGGAAPGGG